jgi:hypothetical protein
MNTDKPLTRKERIEERIRSLRVERNGLWEERIQLETVGLIEWRARRGEVPALREKRERFCKNPKRDAEIGLEIETLEEELKKEIRGNAIASIEGAFREAHGELKRAEGADTGFWGRTDITFGDPSIANKTFEELEAEEPARREKAAADHELAKLKVQALSEEYKATLVQGIKSNGPVISEPEGTPDGKSNSSGQDANQELAVAHELLKRQRRKLQGRPGRDALQSIADSTRKKNGKLNYRAIADKCGITHPTAKKWCEEERIR